MLILLYLSFMAKAEEDVLETKVKSAYVYHLINYIEWAKLPDDAFHVCVLGADSMGTMLQELINRQVKNLPLKINAEDIENPTSCQVLFIGRSVENWHEIVAKLRNSNVLTVSDCENFAQHGGMVGFYNHEGKTKLELNPSAMRTANLKISAKLMEVARIVHPRQ
jgi:hypothetical protein